ncbi:MAG: hypothetical protein ACRED0_03610 [Gammaproteobacteria bacterium]
MFATKLDIDRRFARIDQRFEQLERAGASTPLTAFLWAVAGKIL